MKKLLSIIIFVLMICVVMCACGRNDSVSDMASEAISDVATEVDDMISGDNGTVSDGDGFIGNETTNNNETTANTENNSNTSETNTNESGIM